MTSDTPTRRPYDWALADLVEVEQRLREEGAVSLANTVQRSRQAIAAAESGRGGEVPDRPTPAEPVFGENAPAHRVTVEALALLREMKASTWTSDHDEECTGCLNDQACDFGDWLDRVDALLESGAAGGAVAVPPDDDVISHPVAMVFDDITALLGDEHACIEDVIDFIDDQWPKRFRWEQDDAAIAKARARWASRAVAVPEDRPAQRVTVDERNHVVIDGPASEATHWMGTATVLAPLGWSITDEMVEQAALALAQSDGAAGYVQGGRYDRYARVALRAALGETTAPNGEGEGLPGVPLDDGFDYRPASEHAALRLPPDARQRVNDKIDSVAEARRRAAASAATYVVGGGS